MNEKRLFNIIPPLGNPLGFVLECDLINSHELATWLNILVGSILFQVQSFNIG